MNATPETQPQQPPYEEGKLEDGAPVYDFKRPGAVIDVRALRRDHPRAIALARLPDGRTVMTDGRAMVLAGKRLDSGRFPAEGTLGKMLDDNSTVGMTVGEQFEELGVVDRVVVNPGDAYEYTPPENPDQTSGMNMFESAREILQDFQLTAHAASVGGASVAGSGIVRA